MIGIEARAGVSNGCEGPDEQSGCDDEDDPERHLSKDERLTFPLTAAARVAAARFGQSRAQIHPTGFEGGKRPKMMLVANERTSIMAITRKSSATGPARVNSPGFRLNRPCSASWPTPRPRKPPTRASNNASVRSSERMRARLAPRAKRVASSWELGPNEKENARNVHAADEQNQHDSSPHEMNARTQIVGDAAL